MSRQVPPHRAITMAFAYSGFAGAYLLSYVYRTVNAVISPELTRELALDPAALGLLTSAYFLAFGAFQVPAGMLLDRYGPRRVEPVLLTLAALGSLLFAYADSLGGLIVGRAIIGLGVSVCLMAPLKGIATWYPRERQASLAGWIMVSGGIGALAASAPLEFLLRFVSWHMVFVGLAAVTFAVALFIAWRVPDTPRPEHALGVRAQFAGVADVVRNARFWWVGPLGAMVTGGFMAVQGLWAVPWMIEVEGLTRALAARHLLVMSLTVMAVYLCVGLFATRLAAAGLKAAHLVALGFGLNVVALALITLRVPGSNLWWALYGGGSAVNVLVFTLLNEGFPRDLAGRANTALNLLMFAGSFIAQWGIGVIVDIARDRAGLSVHDGLRIAFTTMLVLDAVVYTWFATRWRRHARSVEAALAA
ncbi:MAG TPA: MFS transporter [Casimicrobiaceae bacterium]|nr:MFS transporter [Casimicrobiaceae bacterium]